VVSMDGPGHSWPWPPHTQVATDIGASHFLTLKLGIFCGAGEGNRYIYIPMLGVQTCREGKRYMYIPMLGVQTCRDGEYGAL
jgi:ABC-type transporter lipoprotein component MlaA